MGAEEKSPSAIFVPGLFLSSLFFGNILLGASNHLRVAPCPILVI
jgi:hypothetical protein